MTLSQLLVIVYFHPPMNHMTKGQGYCIIVVVVVVVVVCRFEQRLKGSSPPLTLVECEHLLCNVQQRFPHEYKVHCMGWTINIIINNY